MSATTAKAKPRRGEILRQMTTKNTRKTNVMITINNESPPAMAEKTKKEYIAASTMQKAASSPNQGRVVRRSPRFHACQSSQVSISARGGRRVCPCLDGTAG